MGVAQSVVQSIVRDLKIPFRVNLNDGTQRVVSDVVNWCSRNMHTLDGRLFDPNWGAKHEVSDLIRQYMFWTGSDHYTAAHKISTAIAGVPDSKLWAPDNPNRNRLATSTVAQSFNVVRLIRRMQRWVRSGAAQLTNAQIRRERASQLPGDPAGTSSDGLVQLGPPSAVYDY